MSASHDVENRTPAYTHHTCTHTTHTPRATIEDGIYLVTDPGMSMVRLGQARHGADTAWLNAAIAATVDLVRQTSAAGIRTIQLRWKHADASPFLDLTLAACEAASPGTAIIVNDRIDVFLAAVDQGADVRGVHIGQHDLPAATVRALVGPRAHIGLSGASPHELAAANALGDAIDAVGTGVLRHTETKPDAPTPLGFDGLARACAASAHPVIAIGGITPDDIPHLAALPIAAAAMVSAIVAAHDPAATAATCLDLWNDNRTETMAALPIAAAAMVSAIVAAHDPAATAATCLDLWNDNRTETSHV